MVYCSMKAPTNGFMANSADAGERKTINSELWHACAGPLVSLPPVGSLVVYFPQGHSEQVAASMQKQTDFVPSYPNLPSKMICMLHNVTLHADPETDEVYAQMTLQPVNKYEKEALLTSEMALKLNRQPTEFFCKTLTASDTSTHGGFSVPRRAAEKIFPPLDFSMQPPAQELMAKDLHDHSWTFRHIYRGQPKRHLLTTGWSVFVSTKRLYAGDSVLFIRNEKQQLLLGIRRAHRQQPALSSSVISSDSMHIGILAAAAHAAANNSPFTIFYNPRASPSEFVVPFAKYQKALYTQVSPGMRFRMMFETEESGVRRYMGTITGISDLDPVRWKDSQWRNLQVGWDESAAGERPSRVSIWDIEPIVTPFYICPPPFFRPKFPRHSGMPDEEFCTDNRFKRAMPWLGDEFGMKDTSNSMFPGLSLVQWMNMQQNNQFSAAAQSGLLPSMLTSTSLQNNMGAEDPSKLLSFQAPTVTTSSPRFSNINPENHVGQLSQPPMTWPQQPKLQQVQQQQLLQSPLNQQQQNNAQQLQQQPWPGHRSVQQPHNQFFPQQQLQVQQQQPPAQLFQSSLNNNVVVSNYLPNQALQQPLNHSQLQQQQLPMGDAPTQQSLLSNKSSLQLTSLSQDLQQVEQKPNLLQRHNEQTQLDQSSLQLLQQNATQKTPQHTPLQQSLPQVFPEQQLQLQMLQKLQQQQQQLLSTSSSSLPPNMQQQQLCSPSSTSLPPNMHQQQSLHQLSLPQRQQQQSSIGFSTSALVQTQRLAATQSMSQHRLPTAIGVPSGLTDGDAPSCSTSPSTNNCQVSASNILNRSQQGLVMRNSVTEPASTPAQEMQSKSDIPSRHELPNSRSLDQLTFRGIVTDQLEASSSGTSYCLDNGSMQQNFSLSKFCLDGDVQSHQRNNLPLANIDGLVPDNLLTQRSDSQKDLQNLLSTYDGNPRDVETELSAAAISSQPFGVTDMSFKPGCSTGITMNEAGVLNNGLWGNQAPRMRTYTKVQKRGSVGRTIDVTRYRGYDELRHDLARIFGIEGQLEDPQRTDWKLVYVDHENDILLVGDDPWEEFVSCVQSIKILSSAEVQQISLDGSLGNLPMVNQACSGTDSGNAWRV